MQASDRAQEASEEYSCSVRHTQRINLDLSSIMDPMLYALISRQVDAVGCSKELILFPLLSSIAALTGPKTVVQITPDWKERLVLWYLVASRKGERKTPALNRIKDAILDIISVDANISFVDEFCAMDITKTTDDHAAVLGCFDDFHDVLQVLETCPKENTAYLPARKYMSMLHDRAVHNHECTHTRRFVNVTGTIDALSAAHLINEVDQYGLFERLFICFAPETSRFGDDYTVVQNPEIMNLSAVFANVHRRHQTKSIYTFTKEGQEEFFRCYENFMQRKNNKHSDDRRRSLVAKAPGHLARLCATLVALRNGMFGTMKSEVASSTPLLTTISENIVKTAYVIVEYLLCQQISMLPAETLISLSDEDDISETMPSVSPLASLMQEHRPSQTMSVLPKTILEQKYNNTESKSRHAEITSLPSDNELLVTPVVRPSCDQHNEHSIDLTSDETSEAIHSILQNASQDIQNTDSMSFHISKVGQQYFTRRPPPVNYTSLSEMSDEEFVKVTAWKLRKLLSCRGLEIPSAWAAQKRLFPPVPKELRTGKSSHPVWAAIAFFERASRVGFGDVVSYTSTAKTAPTYTFRKRRFEELSEKPRAILKKIHLSEEEYANSYPKASTTTIKI